MLHLNENTRTWELAQGAKRFMHQHQQLSADPQHFINKRLSTPVITMLWEQGQQQPWVIWRASLAEWMSSRFRKRPCDKSHGAKQLRMTCSVDRWSLQAWPTHMHTCKHTGTHTKSKCRFYVLTLNINYYKLVKQYKLIFQQTRAIRGFSKTNRNIC